jgi:hypothetical protein
MKALANQMFWGMLVYGLFSLVKLLVSRRQQCDCQISSQYLRYRLVKVVTSLSGPVAADLRGKSFLTVGVTKRYRGVHFDEQSRSACIARFQTIIPIASCGG